MTVKTTTTTKTDTAAIKRAKKLLTPADMPTPPIIEVTKDYRTFSYLPDNRFIRQAHVKQLMRSFEERPYLIPAKPILVNEYFQIADGQHRLEANERLGWWVYYQVVPGLTIDDARVLNALQHTWTILEYADSYARSGYKQYAMFVELAEEYRIPPATLLLYCLEAQGTHPHDDFKLGHFDPMPLDKIVERLKRLEDFSEFSKFYRTAAFGRTVLNLIKNEAYDHERMLAKLESSQAVIPRAAAVQDYLRFFESAYNQNTKKAELRARFY